jgi:hypothetical protein
VILIGPVMLFLVVLGVVAWTRRGNPDGQRGHDARAHRNAIPPNNRPTGPGTGMGDYGASGLTNPPR